METHEGCALSVFYCRNLKENSILSAMQKSQIIERIKKIAADDGKPPGAKYFIKKTGISKTYWEGRYWARWSDALLEAGFSPNAKNEALELDALLAPFLSLVQELGRVPSRAEMTLKAGRGSGFPTYSTFSRRMGSKQEILAKALQFARNGDYSPQTIALIENEIGAHLEDNCEIEPGEFRQIGFVYLMKSGRHYKIGKTNSVDRRKFEIGIQLPLGVEPIHSIETDDPSGIEAYWHSRFKEKRLNGEWFNLSPSDVRTFKKRKFM